MVTTLSRQTTRVKDKKHLGKYIVHFNISHCGKVTWYLSFLILHVDVSAMQDEQGAELSAALLGSFVKGSEIPTINGIDRAVVLDQQGSYIHMLKEGGGGKGEVRGK